MLSEPWKRRLICFANTNMDTNRQFLARTQFPKTVLGRKIYLSKTMSHSYPWVHKIKGEVRRDELLSGHTSNRIGGPADVFIFPKDLKDLQTILKNKGKAPLLVLGEGTNLLVSDKGFRGIVISLKNCFKSAHKPMFGKRSGGTEIGVIQAGAGTKISYLAKFAARYSLTGIENLVGIPGSLGGALVMNAGAEGTEIGQVVRSITRVTMNGEVQILKKEDLSFEYRKTVFPPGKGIIIEAELELTKGDLNTIHETMDRHLSQRSMKQPLSLPNSGSVFKNPPGDTAGRLIESAGLKGFSIGGAGVSIKHANFIVNKGNATAVDVMRLMEHVRNMVKEKTGTELEAEIIVVGD